MNLIDFQFFWASLLDQGRQTSFSGARPNNLLQIFDGSSFLSFCLPVRGYNAICLYVHFAVAFIDFLLYMLVICPCGVRYISILFMSRARQCHLWCTDYIILLSILYTLVICLSGVRFISILFMCHERECHLWCTGYTMLLPIDDLRTYER